MAKRSQVMCKNPSCRSGALGAWANGEFLPSGHLVPGRDLQLQPDPKRGLVVRFVCTYCKVEHEVVQKAGKLAVQLRDNPYLRVGEDGQLEPTGVVDRLYRHES